MKNYSKQREAVATVLKESKCHPTAAQVYCEVRKKLPNISLGTVYRNLKELSESGSILDLSVGDGCDHFDGDLTPHIHLYCKKCGTIFDAPLGNSLGIDSAEENGFVAENLTCIVTGVCKSCNDSINQLNKFQEEF